MDEDALEVLADIAAPGADAQGGEQRGAQHVEPADPCGDAQAGLVEVLDGGFFADAPGDTGEEALEAPGGAPAHGRDRGRGERHGEEVVHELAQALLGHELGVQQITHPRGDAWSVLDRGGDAVREGGHGHGRAGAAEAAVGTVSR